MVQMKGVIVTLALSCVGACATGVSTYEHAIGLMEESPLIDSHIDLPQILRSLSKSSVKFIFRHLPTF